MEQNAPFDWATFKKKRDAYILNLNGIYERNLKNDKVEYIHGRATLTGKNEALVKLDDGSEAIIRAKKILIATGGHPTKPKNVPGSEYGIDSDGFFELEQQPKKVALVGAGYISVEFAGMFNALGSETHLFIRHDTFLRNFDPMISESLTAEYERVGVKIHKKSQYDKVEKKADGKLTIHYRDANGSGVLEDVDTLIWAIGRTPEVEDLGLETVGIKQKESGNIVVDEYQNTTVENYYALGDVCGRAELTPVAIAAGRRLGDRLFGGDKFKDSKLDYSNIPSVVVRYISLQSWRILPKSTNDKTSSRIPKPEPWD